MARDNTLLILGGLGLGAYLLYNAREGLKGLGGVGDAVQGAGTGVAILAEQITDTTGILPEIRREILSPAVQGTGSIVKDLYAAVRDNKLLGLTNPVTAYIGSKIMNSTKLRVDPSEKFVKTKDVDVLASISAAGNSNQVVKNTSSKSSTKLNPKYVSPSPPSTAPSPSSVTTSTARGAAAFQRTVLDQIKTVQKLASLTKKVKK